MAKVLVSGGFPEEAPALLAKALQKAGAAQMAKRAELHAEASAATDTEIRNLVQRGALPGDALAILDASQPSAGLLSVDRVNALVLAMDKVLTAIGEDLAIVASRRPAWPSAPRGVRHPPMGRLALPSQEQQQCPGDLGCKAMRYCANPDRIVRGLAKTRDLR